MTLLAGSRHVLWGGGRSVAQVGLDLFRRTLRSRSVKRGANHHAQAAARGYLTRIDVVHGARGDYEAVLKRLDRFAPTKCSWHSPRSLCRPALQECDFDIFGFEAARQRSVLGMATTVHDASLA